MEKSKVPVNCAFCRGTGISRGAVCPVCREKGKMNITAPTKRCAYCKGNGLQQRGSMLTCGVCRGVGWVTVEEDAVDCPPCGGTGVASSSLGESKLPCLTCKGKGAISAERVKRLPPDQRHPRRRGRRKGHVAMEY
jgi:DnaJ-class molecular chaperone